MRCPQCNKFTGMDNGDPQVDSLDAGDLKGGSVEITVSGQHTRNCSDCGTELKSVSFSESATEELKDFDFWDGLTPEQKAEVMKACDDGNLTAEVEEASVEVDESGGMRYKKNIITITINYEVTVDLDPIVEKVVLSKSGQFTIENAASSYDECC